MIKIALILMIVAATAWLISLILSLVYEPDIDPPTALIIRRFGEIVWVGIGSSWIIKIPKIDTIEELKLNRFQLDIKDLKVTTPDNVSSTFKKVTIELRPIPEKEAVVKFLESGKNDGITKSILPITEQEIRQWARAPGQKPETWEELQSSQYDLEEKLKERLIKACGGEIPETATAAGTKLNNYGVFLDTIAIGEIEPDAEINKAKDSEAKESLERRAELENVKTKIMIAKEIAPLKPKELKAYKMVKEMEILEAGKSGGIYKISLEGLTGIAKRLIGGLGGTE